MLVSEGVDAETSNLEVFEVVVGEETEMVTHGARRHVTPTAGNSPDSTLAYNSTVIVQNSTANQLFVHCVQMHINSSLAFSVSKVSARCL